MNEDTVTLTCTRDTFQPAPIEWVRWLALNADIYRVQQAMRTNGLPAPAYTEWEKQHHAGYRFCAAMLQNRIVARAAVLHHSETNMELTDVSTVKGFERQGYARAVVTFATQYIVSATTTAVCRVQLSDRPMLNLLNSLGYKHVE